MTTPEAQVLAELIASMHEELFRCGDHAALGVDADVVRNWRDRLQDLLSAEPVVRVERVAMPASVRDAISRSLSLGRGAAKATR